MGSMKRILFSLGLGTALMIVPAAGEESSFPAVSVQGDPACPGEARPDRLLGISPEGDLILSSEGLAKLSGIRLPLQAPHRNRAFAWLQERLGHPVLVQGSGSRDRWGRVAVQVRLAGDAAPLDFAQGLVEAGLALVDPGSGEAFCQSELLTFEENARKRSLGLWGDDRYKPLQAEHMDRLRDRVGSYVLIEGRIRSVGERKQRTYLNFGGHWAEDFTIIIPHKTWKLMAERGLGAEALEGRRIRARGILQSWQGVALTVVLPEMIERLEGNRLAR